MTAEQKYALGKKLLDNLQSDLRLLYSESKKKHANVKEVGCNIVKLVHVLDFSHSQKCFLIS